MVHRIKVSAVAVVVAMVGLGLSATAAGATSSPGVTCGQTITASVVLRADLACSGDALIIGASNVTVDLAGHTISSTDGAGMGIRFGVPATDTARAVCVESAAVRGGRISGFFGALTQSGCSTSTTLPNRVSALDLEANTWGVFLQAAAHVAVDRTTIVGANGVGGLFAPGAQTGVVELTRSRIQVTTSDGFSVLAALAPSTIVSSRLEGGRVDSIVGGNVTITGSRMTGVQVLCGDSDVTISDTRVIGGGIQTGAACGYHLADDRFVGPGSGVAVSLGPTSFPSTVTGSTFTGWDIAIAVGAAHVAITGDTFRDNGNGVVSCTSGGCSGTVSGNAFLHNSGTGLLLTSGTWAVGSNLALRNGGLGIDAEGPGLVVTDDGGNIARRNQPPQCIGVVCAPHA